MLRRKEKKLKQERKEGKVSLISVLFFIFLFFQLNFISLVLAEEANVASSDFFSTSLDEVEEKVFFQKYSSDKKEDRLSRIEEFLFGTADNKKTNEERLNKITSSLTKKNTNKPIPQENSEIVKPPEKPQVTYDKDSSRGVIDTISQIEKKLFYKTFDELPFQSRVEQLESKVLTQSELNISKRKSLLERVTILVQRTGNSKNNPQNQEVIKPVQRQPQYQKNQGQQNYRIDPNTGEIVNEITGEVVKDSYGNSIMVKIPTQLPFQQPFPQDDSYFPQAQGQYGNNFPNQGNPLQQNPYQQQFIPGGGQFPYNLLTNPNNFDPGNNQNY